MKKNYLFSAVTFICSFFNTVSAQQHAHQHAAHTSPPQVLQVVQTTFDEDSLQGYDENQARQHAYLGNVLGMDLQNFINYTKRNYINRKYNLNQPQARPAGPGGGNTPQAPCTNVDFETGTTAGWTVSGDVVTTSGAGIDPYGNFPVVCPGGNFSLKLGNATNPANSIAKQTFAVTPANSYYLLKMAMVILNFPHTATDAAKVYIRFRDQSNNIVACPYFECYYANTSGGGGGSFGLTGFQTGSNGVNIGNQSYPTTYIPWTNVGFDLTPYIGQNITIEIENDWCVYNYDWAYTYIDGQCQQLTTSVTGGCAGTVGTLVGPTGMTSYTWTGPPTSTVSAVHTQTVHSTVSGIYTVQCSPYSSCGTATYTYTMNLVSSNNPIANFNFTTTPCQSTYSVPYTDNTNLNGGPAISNYYWDFDNNGTVDNTTANPTYAFPGPGTYTTKLKVSNGGCLDSINKTVTIVAGPTANFNLANNCVGAASNFTSTSTPTAAIVSQVWNWGDASPNGSGTSPSHTFASAGNYNVKLVVTNSSLCKDSITKPITIYPKPVISFSAAPVCFGSASTFTNSSTVTPAAALTWAWDFDNNGTVDNTTQSPTNAYAAAGTYTAELRATTPNGCRDSATVAVKVNVIPTATFTPVNACIGNNVVLNNTSSVPNPDNISQYNWTFGAGSTPASSTNQNPPSLTYASSGTQTITLNITANTTCTASITKTITVYPSPTVSFSATAVCQATQTAFTDLSTTGTGVINAWSWDFTNDGIVDNNTQNPGFTYPASGTYTASLLVSTSNGCSNTFTLPVNVWGHTIPNFTPDNVCYGTATTFTNLTNTTTNANVGGAPSYSWAFADGSPVDNNINPVHTYTLGANGNAAYNVTLTVTSSHNCVDNVIKTVNVYALPVAAFTSNTVCLGSASTLTDASNGNGNVITGYQWDFLSNGTIDVTGTANPNYTFPAYGINAVSYTVSTTPVAGLTCSNSTNTITVYVDPSPVPDFTFVNNCINAQPNSFDASGTFIAVGTNTNYAWAYGDGATATGTTAITSHSYNTPATYNVTLTVTSNKGCVKQVVKQVQVYNKPHVNIVYKNACDGSAVTFTAVSQANSGTVTDWYWDYNNNLATVEATGQASNFIYPAAGQQTVGLITVSNPGQCRDTVKAYPYVNYIPKPNFTVDDPDGCSTHCVTFTDGSSVTGPAKITNWTWRFGDNSSAVSATSPASQSKCYENTTGNQLKYFDIKLVVNTDSGCTAFKEYKSMITVFPLPVASYTINPDPGNVVTPLEYFTNYSQNYTKWYWTFGDGGYKTDSTNVNPTHFYNSETAQTYYTNLIVVNQYGCSDTAMVPIDIGPEFAFYIPNAFTPVNSDNINDTFTGKGIGIATYDMWIFDRWGEMIYYTDDISKGWDGKKNGKSQEVKQEVYIWKVKIKDVFGTDHNYVGHVTLLR